MKTTKIEIMISSLSDILFDRFIDHSREQRPPEQKLYLIGKNMVVLPTENLEAFLFGDDPPGCARNFEGKKGKQYRRMGQAHVFFDDVTVPFLDEKNKPIKFEGFGDTKKFYTLLSAPRVKQGGRTIKQEASLRPILRHPWKIRFSLVLLENTLIDATKLHNWFVLGGMQIGIGAYRPKYGRFSVESFEEIAK